MSVNGREIEKGRETEREREIEREIAALMSWSFPMHGMLIPCNFQGLIMQMY